MPTIKQLPLASSVGAADVIPVSQGGTTRSLTVGNLLSSTQAAISLVPGKLLGRVSATVGGPEPLGLGNGLAIGAGSLASTLSVAFGTTAVTAAAGNDARIVGAVQASNNLADVVSAPAARANLGLAAVAATGAFADLFGAPVLGGAASLNTGTTAGTVAAGDDPRIVGALTSGAAAAAFTPLNVTSAGGSRARSMAARAADAASVLDQTGVDRSGVADSAAAFAAAQAAAAAANVNAVVPSGDYTLGSVISMAPGQSWELTGVKFSGPGTLANSGDWSAFLNRLGKAWISYATAPGNSFGTYTGLTIGPTVGTVSYEKAAGYDYVLTYDPSTVGVTDRDAVGRQMTATIAPGNMTGRVWGFAAQANVSAGADGAAAGGEIDVINNGTDQPLQGTSTSKTGLGIIAFGSRPSTVALNVASGGNHFHDGISIAQEAVSDKAFRITAAGSNTVDTFYVTPAGGIMAASVGTAGGTVARFGNTAAAVNHLVLTGGAATGAVGISTEGGDAAPALTISPAGPLNLSSGTGAVTVSTALFGLSGTFSGALVIPTMPATDNSSNGATTGFVHTAIANLVSTAPGTLDTLGEIAAALAADEGTAAALATTVAGKLAKASNLADLASVSAARSNLGLGGAALLGVGATAGSVAAGDDSRITGALQATTAASSYQPLLGFTPYNAANPAGYQTAANVATALGAYTLTTSLNTAIAGLATVARSGQYSDLLNAPAIVSASSTAPLVNGTAATGTAVTFARADHVHPTDTSRAPAPGGLVVSGTSSYAMSTGDSVVIIRRTAAAATSVTLPGSPTIWATYTVKDGKGDAAVNNITITPASGMIDGATGLVVNANYRSVTLVFDGTNWSVI